MLGRNTTLGECAKVADEFVMAFHHAPIAHAWLKFYELREHMEAVYRPSPESGPSAGAPQK